MNFMKFKWILAPLLALSLCGCAPSTPTGGDAVSSPETSSSTPEKKPEYPIEIALGEETFNVEDLTPEAAEKITGVSWKPNDHIQLEDLSLLTLSYYGFDGKYYTGQMIAAKTAAPDLTAIFQELFESRYPIEKMQLMEAYGADDNLAMADNNCSAFCYREIDGTQVLSNHSYGLAVDINPVQNPYVRGDLVQPDAGAGYLDRENLRPGMIARGDVCYNAFIARGWDWGGDWTGPIDYQHFEKTVS